MSAPHRPRRIAAVVGLVAGLALLLGAVLDGGMASPTRTDDAAAVPHSEVAAPAATPREDRSSWGQAFPASRIVLVVTGLLALAVAATVAPPAPSHLAARRAPTVLAARHRGPPVVA